MTKARIALCAASILFVVVPFLLVTFPPVTDLPQQLAQARLLPDALAHPDAPYRVQWLTPYLLSYLPILLFSKLFSPFVAGRLTMIFLGLATAIALHVTAARRNRAPEAAVLASIFFFSQPMYWGFLSFLVGVPIFLAWISLVGRPARGPRDALIYVLGAALLYFAHGMWFLLGLVWLAVWFVRVLVARQLTWADFWPRAAGMAPIFVLAVLRASAFDATSSNMAPGWMTSPFRRIGHIVTDALGGLRGPTEAIVLAAVAAWLLAGAWQAWRTKESIDRELVGAGALLVVLFLTLPDSYLNTLLFAQRWLPIALMLLLLGLPTPALAPVVRRAGVVALAAVFCLATVSAWRTFNDDELTGLEPALAALPDEPRVIGLDFMKHSPTIDGSPFLQEFAWAQVLHGGRLNFSFAEHQAPLVRFGPAWKGPTWTPSLEWYAEQVQPRDLAQFDYAIVGAPPEIQEKVAALPQLDAVTTEGRWRLYKVRSNVSR